MSCIRKYLQKKYKKILLYCSVYAIVVVFLLFSNIINIFFSFPYTLTYNIDLLKLRGYTACATLIPVILTYFISDFFYKDKFKVLFYSILFIFEFYFLLAAFYTHGQTLGVSIHPLNDDVLMDFFNSMQYGMKPYENKVIYPPLMNVIYGFMGRFIPMAQVGSMGARVSQAGALTYSTYIILVYSFLFWVLYSFKQGNGAEKLIFIIGCFFSMPFLFAFERGNSVIIAFALIIFYAFTYNIPDKKIKYFSFIALGVVTALKVVPAILGVLLIKEKRWKDTIICISIGAGIFFLPFVLTDGNIFNLVENIRNTTNFYQGYYVDYDGIRRLIGQGLHINILNFFKAMQRITNIELFRFAESLNLFILLGCLSISLLSEKRKKWITFGALGVIMAACPGFSTVYNIGYLIPSLMFLLQDPNERKYIKVIALLLFLGMLVPIFRFNISIFDTFWDDRYPLHLAVFIENLSLCIFSLLIVLYGYFSLVTSNKYSERNWLVIGLFLIIVIFSLYTFYRSTPIDNFTPTRNDAVRASTGFILNQGEYGYFNEKVTVSLKTTKLNANGLVISYKNTLDNRLSLKLNDKDVDYRQTYINGNNVIYVSREELLNLGLLNNDHITVELFETVPGINGAYINYIGPLEPLSEINSRTYVGNSSAGVDKTQNGLLHMRTKALFLIKNDLVIDKSQQYTGIVFRFFVPEAYSFLKDNPLHCTISFGNRKVKNITIDHTGEYNIFITENDLIGIDKTVINKAIIPFEISIDDFAMDSSGIYIQYIGNIQYYTEYNFLSGNRVVGHGVNCKNGYFIINQKYVDIPFKFETAKEKGIYLVYQVFKSDKEDGKQVQLLINGKMADIEEIPFDENHFFKVLYIGSDNFSNIAKFGKITIIDDSLNRPFNLVIDANGKYDNDSLKVFYVGSELPDCIKGGMPEVIPFVYGISTDRLSNQIYISKYGEFILSSDMIKKQGLEIIFRVSKELMSNKEEGIHCDLFINGKHFKDIKVDSAGEYKVSIDAEDINNIVKDSIILVGIRANENKIVKDWRVIDGIIMYGLDINYIGPSKEGM